MKKLFHFASIAALVAACGKNDDNTPQQPVAKNKVLYFLVNYTKEMRVLQQTMKSKFSPLMQKAYLQKVRLKA